MKTFYANLSKRCLLPVAALDAAGDAVQLARALHRAGLPVLEISLTTPVALRCIEAIRSALPDFWVGAGTLLCSAQVQDALLAGARFGASPAMHPETVDSASRWAACCKSFIRRVRLGVSGCCRPLLLPIVTLRWR